VRVSVLEGNEVQQQPSPPTMSGQQEVRIRKERRKKERKKERKSVISRILSKWHCTLAPVVIIKNNVLYIREKPG
jgi:hypothetical protein